MAIFGIEITEVILCVFLETIKCFDVIISYHQYLCIQKWEQDFLTRHHLMVWVKNPFPLLPLRHISINEPISLPLSLYFPSSISFFLPPISLFLYSCMQAPQPLLLNRTDSRWGQGHKETITRLIGRTTRG